MFLFYCSKLNTSVASTDWEGLLVKASKTDKKDLELYKQTRDGATDPVKLDNISKVEDDLLNESSLEASLMISEEND